LQLVVFAYKFQINELAGLTDEAKPVGSGVSPKHGGGGGGVRRREIDL
jgi:hypothetical protein